MARPQRFDVPGSWHHIFNRGQRKEPIFSDEIDRLRFLDLLGEVDTLYGVEINAYCLLDNHYHLLAFSRHGRVSEAMKRIDGVYTQSYNARHGHDGALFRGRFGSKLVEADQYLERLVVYVHRNPIEAGISRTAVGYRWSSYAALTQRSAPPSWLSRRALEVIGSPNRAELDAMVHDSDHDHELHELLAQPSFGLLGSEEWVEQICDGRNPATQRSRPRRSLDEIISAVGEHFDLPPSSIRAVSRGRRNEPRRLAMWIAGEEHLCPHSEIAEAFGLSPGSVAVALHRLRSDPPEVPADLKLLMRCA